jgi:hypothetical protein
MVFQCEKHPLPLPSGKPIETAIENELPAFLRHLLYEYTIPEAIRDERFGVRAFIHESVKADLDDIDPRQTVAEILQTLYAGKGPQEKTVTNIFSDIGAYGFPHELTKSLSVYTLSRVLAKIVPRPGLLGPSRAYSSESQRTLLEVEFSTCRRKRTVISKCKDYELIVSWGFLCRRTYDDSDGNQVGSGQGLERTD